MLVFESKAIKYIKKEKTTVLKLQKTERWLVEDMNEILEKELSVTKKLKFNLFNKEWRIWYENARPKTFRLRTENNLLP